MGGLGWWALLQLSERWPSCQSLALGRVKFTKLEPNLGGGQAFLPLSGRIRDITEVLLTGTKP